MRRRQPVSTRTDTPFPYTTLVRSTEFPGHLIGQFAGRAQHQRLHPCVGYLDAVQDAQAKGSRLAAAGGCLRDQVVAGKNQRQALRLYRRHFDITKGIQTLVQRSEEHTSELQSLMRISYAVFCLKKKQKT